MFSIWIGPRPTAAVLECLAANDARHGLTLIASSNWVGATNFRPLDVVVAEAITDPRVRALWEAFPEPAHRSDVLRVWYLMQNPQEVYVDSDCILHSIPSSVSVPLFPSIQAQMDRVAASYGCVPDMDEIHNSTGQWLDVWAIIGAGDSSFYSAWLDLWVRDFFRPGGISEALSHGPFNVGVLPKSHFTHFSVRKTKFAVGAPP